MKKSIIIISSFFIVALVAGSVFAWGHGNGQARGAGWSENCPRYGGQNGVSDLTQEQKDELSALRQKFIDETYELRSAKFQKRQEMRMLMETSEPDRAKIDALLEQEFELEKQLRVRRIDFLLAAKKISPELGMGAGFGKGRSKWSKRGGQKDCQGQGQGNQRGCLSQGKGQGRGCDYAN